MDERERMASTFVELADTLVDDFDLVDFLSLLTQRCVELLGVAEVGMMLADKAGNLRFIAASTERARLLELFELQNEEGPCLDCFRSGEQLVNQRLDVSSARWPRY